MADTVKVFAHRGDSALFAENTRAAFAHALAIGAHGIETDIQLSADGHRSVGMTPLWIVLRMVVVRFVITA